MKRLLLAGIVSFSLVLPATTALAGGYYHGYGGHHYGGHHYSGHNSGDDLLIAAGIIGGAFLLGSFLSQPRYYAPPPAYYPPQPAYVPSCYQEEVWRHLPDGRIQTGIRTRCY